MFGYCWIFREIFGVVVWLDEIWEIMLLRGKFCLFVCVFVLFLGVKKYWDEMVLNIGIEYFFLKL